MADTRWYYGIQHTFGGQVLRDEGHAGLVVRFATTAQRDEWVDGGNAYSTQPGARAALSPRSARDRRAISAYAEQVKYYGDPTP